MSARVRSTKSGRWSVVAVLLLLLVFASCDDEDGDGAPVAVPAYQLDLVRFE